MGYITDAKKIKELAQQLSSTLACEEDIEKIQDGLTELKEKFMLELNYYEAELEEVEHEIDKLYDMTSIVELYENNLDWKNTYTLAEFVEEFGGETLEELVDGEVANYYERTCEKYNSSRAWYLSMDEVHTCIRSLKELIGQIESLEK